ncbi:DASH family cryptochrome [Pulveribacter sp.]|uniref:DASH family cryptochrome n=1 Tax=Pulveribacter sp. TaxID=2678893 RepID=UPI0028A79E0B|nr:DASH family cryptochrome [Pulveribacter sp.]
MTTTIFWFRNDLRLHDQVALQAAMGARRLLPVVCTPGMDAPTAWGFARMGRHRRAWWASAVRHLARALQTAGSQLLVLDEPPATALPALAQAVGADGVVCEDIAAPDEQAEVAAVRAAGLPVLTIWHSSLFDPAQLPWPLQQLPDSFTHFRQAVEQTGLTPAAPLPPVGRLAPWPRGVPDSVLEAQRRTWARLSAIAPAADARSAFPYLQSGLHAGESAARAHLARYLASDQPARHKRARNSLAGQGYSSKWSPWLATGALSPRKALEQLRRYEAVHGASEGTRCLWLELLWRDHLRFLHLRHGPGLYRARGLAQAPTPTHQPDRFAAWCAGRTGQPLADAGMRELAATGYLGNRLRQIVASFLVHDLACEWRAGAAWFEHQLLDYDVYSNRGNWIFLASRRTHPRARRRFDPARQAGRYDPDGHYRQLWGTA